MSKKQMFQDFLIILAYKVFIFFSVETETVIFSRANPGQEWSCMAKYNFEITN